jgi:hypothetical protein
MYGLILMLPISPLKLFILKCKSIKKNNTYNKKNIFFVFFVFFIDYQALRMCIFYKKTINKKEIRKKSKIFHRFFAAF